MQQSLGFFLLRRSREDTSDLQSDCNKKHVLETIKLMLTGKDAIDVERDLARENVKQRTLTKIEKIDKDIADICL